MFYKNCSMLLVIIMFSVFLLPSCKSKVTIVEENLPAYDQKVEEFVVTRLFRGKISMTLEGKSAVIDTKKSIADLDHPVIKFYDEGNYVSDLITESARINTETYDVKCNGKCLVKTINGESLQTTNLTYNSGDNLVYSNNNVKFTKPGEVVYGKGFESDIRLNNIVIRNQRILID